MFRQTKWICFVLFYLVCSINIGAQLAETCDQIDPAPGVVDTIPPAVTVWPAESQRGVIYDNGPLVNSTGTGAGGADESVLQNSTLSMGTYGYGVNPNANLRLADDFTWSSSRPIDSIVFFAYQTGSTTTSTITGLYLRIWNGAPNNPSSQVIWGDTTTNVMTSTTWGNIYRRSQTTAGNTTRPVMRIVVNMGGLTLAPGTYWLDWQITGSLASGPWVPPITINGQTTTGNAIQYTGAWNSLVDVGAQGLPFLIQGNSAPSNLRATIRRRQIELYWDDNAADETSFEIQREQGGVFVPIGWVNANVTSYLDWASASNTQRYRVRAMGASGELGVSEVLTVSINGDEGSKNDNCGASGIEFLAVLLFAAMAKKWRRVKAATV